MPHIAAQRLSDLEIRPAESRASHESVLKTIGSEAAGINLATMAQALTEWKRAAPGRHPGSPGSAEQAGQYEKWCKGNFPPATDSAPGCRALVPERHPDETSTAWEMLAVHALWAEWIENSSISRVQDGPGLLESAAPRA